MCGVDDLLPPLFVSFSATLPKCRTKYRTYVSSCDVYLGPLYVHMSY